MHVPCLDFQIFVEIAKKVSSFLSAECCGSSASHQSYFLPKLVRCRIIFSATALSFSHTLELKLKIVLYILAALQLFCWVTGLPDFFFIFKLSL